MNVVLIILVSAFTGTTLMTLFSYFLTYILKTQFKEPVLLYKLLEKSAWIEEESINVPVGWLLHYAAGIGFVIFYYLLWSFTALKISFFNGGLLGLASGFFGVGVWWIIFRIHQNPPSINLKDYFIHLIAVHIIFGLGATTCYYFLEG